ncbi:hypothetical protein KCP71_11710 [Salmonella enterica subsp. enterica]|nr:hypothetical protein KCP71_11710 [Salmonella enterica subsp. enterica]
MAQRHRWRLSRPGKIKNAFFPLNHQLAALSGTRLAGVKSEFNQTRRNKNIRRWLLAIARRAGRMSKRERGSQQGFWRGSTI